MNKFLLRYNISHIAFSIHPFLKLINHNTSFILHKLLYIITLRIQANLNYLEIKFIT